MQSSRYGTSVPPAPLDSAFSPAYLAHLREQDDSLTAAEAELSGPWKIEPVPGKPGAVAVLRQWEEVEAGDPPVAVLWHEETPLPVRPPAVGELRGLSGKFGRGHHTAQGGGTRGRHAASNPPGGFKARHSPGTSRKWRHRTAL
jgi:hypothetical protein